MAKKAEPAKEIVLTDKQKAVAKQFESDVEKTTTYKSIAAIVKKLDNQKTKLSSMEVNALINFYKSNKFSEDEISSLALNDDQKNQLITSVAKLKNVDLAYRFASETLLNDNAYKNISNLINKDKEKFSDYAVLYYETHRNDNKSNWCPTWILNNVKKNLASKKPKEESYEYLASFAHRTMSCRTEEENNAMIQKWADLLFGTDEEIAKKKLKRNKAKLTEQKKNFLSNIGVAIAEQYNAEQKAKLDVLEAEENEKLKNDDEFMAIVNRKTNEIFNERHKGDFKASQDFMAKLKQQHPKDFDKYLNKLRNSRGYKKAYKKYMDQYTKEKEAISQGVFDEIKTTAKNESQRQVIAENKQVNTKESAPEQTL